MNTKTREYNDCYIAFLDLMGFKNIIGKRNVKRSLAFSIRFRKNIFSKWSQKEEF